MSDLRYDHLESIHAAACARIEELKSALLESCGLIDEITEDTPERHHAVRSRRLRLIAEGVSDE